ncbi:flagellar modification protein B [Leptospira perolatii]|uniref:Flagellar modification protein B n=1 Tax=Leptospira perolatii TaxID=2023191 RepID=A0A2M9ZL81_9LEPT|nr:acylneuraminate cytidylyltransferase family protein [Leptospira perolatii]PJZ70290.1 flagellar modification protein B [Leptospira perolatii]PJZ72826.1 flagellar modification protein B [Leptospira perolatii]
MGNSKLRLCSICARGGSKGIKNKNIRVINNLPLIAYSILQAQEAGIFDYIAVSSDSQEILNVASQYGVKFLIERPLEFALDTSAKIPAIRHCVESVENMTKKKFDTLVDLDATSPLRLSSDIVAAVSMMEDKNCSNVITGCVARRSPYFNLVEMNENGFVKLSKPLEKPIVRRQDSPRCFDMNASIYAWKRDVFLKEPKVFYDDTIIYEMPDERSIDIDSELDFQIVEFLLKKRA